MTETKASAKTRVRVSLGYTTNMGDFESLRTDYAVETDTLDGESADAAVARVEKLVEAKLTSEVKKLREALNK